MKPYFIIFSILFIAITGFGQNRKNCQSTQDTIGVLYFVIDKDTIPKTLIRINEKCTYYGEYDDDVKVKYFTRYQISGIFNCSAFDSASSVTLLMDNYTISQFSLTYRCAGCPDEEAQSNSNQFSNRQLQLVKCNRISKVYLDGMLLVDNKTGNAMMRANFELRYSRRKH